MCHSRTLLCLSTLILSLSSFTIADDAAVMIKLLAALSPTPSGWSNSTDYCQWTNVNCSSDSRVTIIALVSQNLSGILPSNLGSLTELRSLSVQGNNFSGPLPSLAYLSSLEQLYLDNNYFSSIPDGFFQGLTSLKILFLSQNKKLARWTFPTELTQSTSLVTLDAGSANLFESLPDIFNVPNLKDLRLSFNNLTGPIPDLSKCIKLFDLQLRDNQFTGIVPDSLISLSSMKSISLSNNELQGPLPEFASNVDINDSDNSFCKNISGPCDPQVTILLEVAAALGYPIKLARFWKGNDACGDWSFITCNSQGKIISVNFGKQGFVGRISPAIANLTSLRNLSLNDNYLTDSIPDSLTTLPDLQLLDVSNNNLTGSIPKFTSTVKLISAPGNPLLGTSAGSQRLKAMIIALATLFVGIGVVIIMICCLRRKFSFNKIIYFWRRESRNYQTIQAFLRNHEPLAIKKYSHSDIKKMTNSFSDQLGEGGYGSVYKGKLQDGCLVAVKVLNELRGNGEEFINEVASIIRTSHVNIVSLMGYCFESSIRALIYEFMPNGSLEKFIYKESPSMVTGRQLECMTLYKIALGIARGLEYLHKGCNTRIVHFDIKPHNILLDENFFPKISDFGLAQICSRENSIITMMGARGTMGYIAPEVCGRNVAGVSYKSDVYSYGMMVFEMVGGRRNIDVKIDRTSKIYFPHWIYKRFEQDEDLGLEAFMNEEDHETARKMIIVSLCCIQADPSSRPSMSEVVNMLEGSLESLPVPRNPFLSLPSRSPEV